MDHGQRRGPAAFAQPARPLETDVQQLAGRSWIVDRDESGEVVPGAQVRPAKAQPFGQVDRSPEQGHGLEHPAHARQRRCLRDQRIGDDLGIAGSAGVLERGVRGPERGGRLLVQGLGSGELGVQRSQLPVAHPLAQLLDRLAQQRDRRLHVGPVDQEPAAAGERRGQLRPVAAGARPGLDVGEIGVGHVGADGRLGAGGRGQPELGLLGLDPGHPDRLVEEGDRLGVGAQRDRSLGGAPSAIRAWPASASASGPSGALWWAAR